MNDTNNKWCIYKHTNKVNGKVYIGQTCRKPEDRWGKDGSNYDTCFPFGKAIKKYGWNNFDHEIIEEGIDTVNLANEREAWWISFYHSYIKDPINNGYNATKGGDNREHLGVPVYQIDANDLHIIKEYTSCTEAANILGLLAQNIGCCCGRSQITAGGYFWCYKKDYSSLWNPPVSKKEKPVVQIDMDTLEAIAFFDSVSEASKETQISLSGISKCCLREGVSAGGYYWSYVLEYGEDWSPKERGIVGKGSCKAIICYETKEVFESVAECSLITGISTQNLCQNCCQGHRSAKGYHYAYLNEYNEDWTPAPQYDTKRRKAASTRKKAVWCVQTKRFYPSAANAAEELKLDVRRVCRACSGELIQTGGYNFCWKEDWFEGWKPRDIKKGKQRAVRCIETDEIFESVTIASRNTGTNISTITMCCRGKRKIAGGYHWKYINDIN